jgi:predicted DNA-binding protein
MLASRFDRWHPSGTSTDTLREQQAMQRKHILLPDALNARVKAAAEKLEMSAAEFIRRAIEAALEKAGA